MPPQKTKVAVTRMESKIDALESELAAMRTSLTAVTAAMKDLPSMLVTMVDKAMGKSVAIEGNDEGGVPREVGGDKTPVSSGGKG